MQLKLIENKIHEVRGTKIILDFDLAILYGVENRVLKQTVRRNLNRFPSDFMFGMTSEEYNALRSQIVTLNSGRGKHSKYLPFAFTEQGVAMLSSALKSKKAVQMNISIMRAFVVIRQYALSHKDLTKRLKEIETKYDKQFKDVYEAIKFLLDKEKNKETIYNRKRISFKP
jgi:hypothetical protein